MMVVLLLFNALNGKLSQDRLDGKLSRIGSAPAAWISKTMSKLRWRAVR